MSRLETIRTGTRSAPDRIMLVGVEGVGKSTFGANAPSPIFLATEDGVRHLNVASFPEPATLEDAMENLRALYKDEHDYKTLVVDTLDWLEPMVWMSVCKKRGWKDIEEPGYGKGYTAANDAWRTLLAACDALRHKRGMEIILIAHAANKTLNNPAGGDYSRYEPKLQRGAAALCKEWCDSVLFATYEVFVREKDKKGVSTGHRVLKTTWNAAWDAKNRHSLPEELPLSYEDYDAARAAGMPESTEKLLVQIADMLPEVPEDKREKVRQFVADHRGDASMLAQALDRIRSLIAGEQ